MQLNGNKFQHSRYDGTSLGNHSNLTPAGIEMQLYEEFIDLGVIMQNTAKFDSQIWSAANKGKRPAGWILRVFSTIQEMSRITLFKSLPYWYCAWWSTALSCSLRKLLSLSRSWKA